MTYQKVEFNCKLRVGYVLVTVIEGVDFFFINILQIIHIVLGFPGGSVGKESACNVGDLGSVPGRSPEGGDGHPLQCSCLEKPHEQKSLVGLQSMWSQRVGHN